MGLWIFCLDVYSSFKVNISAFGLALVFGIGVFSLRIIIKSPEIIITDIIDNCNDDRLQSVTRCYCRPEP
jgi:hypothetical protein